MQPKNTSRRRTRRRLPPRSVSAKTPRKGDPTSDRVTGQTNKRTSRHGNAQTQSGLTNRRAKHPALANQTAQPGLRATSHKHTTRLAIRRHNRQFVQPTIGTEVLRRSLFGLVIVYNLLPQAVVDEKSVQSFQSSLQRALRNVARLGVPNWDCLFSPRLRPVRAFDFQRYFA